VTLSDDQQERDAAASAFALIRAAMQADDAGIRSIVMSWVEEDPKMLIAALTSQAAFFATRCMAAELGTADLDLAREATVEWLAEAAPIALTLDQYAEE